MALFNFIDTFFGYIDIGFRVNKSGEDFYFCVYNDRNYIIIGSKNKRTVIEPSEIIKYGVFNQRPE